MRYSLESVDKPHLQAEYDIKEALEKVSSFLPLEDAFFEIYLVSDDFNVHSYEPAPNFPYPNLEGGEYFLGEIHLNPEKIMKNDESLIFMLIHGLLHLLGYDHKNDDDRIKMEKKEAEILKLLGESF
ncbi:MAG: rRNA maturation RNase YbeY [Candidatus Harrisonbacteria bacterium]|nr:rRNA maturation RNase YbeY [Candidatus Harrisonbacteria bacterium]